MSALDIAIGLGALVAGFGLVVFFLVRVARQQGRAEQQARTDRALARQADAMARIAARHDRKRDVRRRLRDGSF